MSKVIVKKKGTPAVDLVNEPETAVSSAEAKSAKYQAFAALIEAYKVQNPAKYQVKKDKLEAELAKLA